MFSDSPGSFGAQLTPHHAFLQSRADSRLRRRRAAANRCRSSSATYLRNGRSPLRSRRIVGQLSPRRITTTWWILPSRSGPSRKSDFTAACGSYRVIFDANTTLERGCQDRFSAKSLLPLQRIVSTATQWMNDCPFQTYMFIYHATDSPSSGGMEHAYSTAINLNQKDFTGDLEHFTSVTAHEFFHLWNVKRIRPQSLEPIDYTKENYTTALWFSEGVDTDGQRADSPSRRTARRAALFGSSRTSNHRPRRPPGASDPVG